MFIFGSSEQTMEIGLSGLILSDFLYKKLPLQSFKKIFTMFNL